MPKFARIAALLVVALSACGDDDVSPPPCGDAAAGGRGGSGTDAAAGRGGAGGTAATAGSGGGLVARGGSGGGSGSAGGDASAGAGGHDAGCGTAGASGTAGGAGGSGRGGTTGIAGAGGLGGLTGLAGRGGTTGLAGVSGTTGIAGITGTAGATGTGGAADPCAQLPVNLGAALSPFAILAGSTVTSTGATMTTGDLGLSPGSSVTGFPPGVLVGVMHVGDPAAALAQLALTTAYNDAAGRTLCPITIAGNLGGRTLLPGLYKSATSLEISSGDLTLAGNGVYIFQMGTTWTTTVGRAVILALGAQAKNIFWQVGTSATLGTGSVMYGTIMADQSITLTTGATLTGRALARIAAVTLDSNTVIVTP